MPRKTARIVHATATIFSFHLFASFIQPDVFHVPTMIQPRKFLFTCICLQYTQCYTHTHTRLTHSCVHIFQAFISFQRAMCADALKSWILGCYTNLLFILKFPTHNMPYFLHIVFSLLRLCVV